MSNTLEQTDVTDVKGYFNGNSFPIQIQISSLGMNFTLAPGQFITAKNTLGQLVKVNDDLFIQYVGKNRLSVEKSVSGPVPRIAIQSRDERGQVNQFRELKMETQEINQRTVQVPVPTPPSPTRVGPQQSITAMSMEEAYRSGKLPRPRTRVTQGVNETDGAPLRGDSIPEITYDDGDLVSQEQARAKRAMEAGQKMVSGQKVQAPILEVKKDTMAPAIIPQTVKPVVIPQREFPTLEDAKNVTAPSVPVPPKASFECLLCKEAQHEQAPFVFRSQLESHARKIHPDQIARVLEPYPKPQNRSSQPHTA